MATQSIASTVCAGPIGSPPLMPSVKDGVLGGRLPGQQERDGVSAAFLNAGEPIDTFVAGASIVIGRCPSTRFTFTSGVEAELVVERVGGAEGFASFSPRSTCAIIKLGGGGLLTAHLHRVAGDRVVERAVSFVPLYENRPVPLAPGKVTSRVLPVREQQLAAVHGSRRAREARAVRCRHACGA